MFVYLAQVGSAALFAVKDASSPFLIATCGGVLNFALNTVFCSDPERWFGSAIAGASVATVVTQIITAIAIYALLAYRGLLPDLRVPAHELTAGDRERDAPQVPLTQLAHLWYGLPVIRRFVHTPTLKRLVPRFMEYAGPMVRLGSKQP